MESLLCVVCSKETVHMPSDWSVGKPIVKIEFTNCEESKQNHSLNRPSISPVTKVIQWAIIFTVRPATRSGSDVFVLPRHFIRFLRLKGNVQKLTGWNKKEHWPWFGICGVTSFLWSCFSFFIKGLTAFLMFVSPLQSYSQSASKVRIPAFLSIWVSRLMT